MQFIWPIFITIRKIFCGIGIGNFKIQLLGDLVKNILHNFCDLCYSAEVYSITLDVSSVITEASSTIADVSSIITEASSIIVKTYSNTADVSSIITEASSTIMDAYSITVDVSSIIISKFGI
jgi:hypothetical protein